MRGPLVKKKIVMETPQFSKNHRYISQFALIFFPPGIFYLEDTNTMVSVGHKYEKTES